MESGREGRWPGWRAPGPYLQTGIVGHQIGEDTNPPQSPLLHNFSLRPGEVQQHLGREKLLVSTRSKHSPAPGPDLYHPSRLPLTSHKACSGVLLPGVPHRPGQSSQGNLLARKVPPSAATVLQRSLVPAPASSREVNTLPTPRSACSALDWATPPLQGEEPPWDPHSACARPQRCPAAPG